MEMSSEWLMKLLAGQRVVITGASGFIGSQLARGLLAAGCRVTAVVRPASDLWRLVDVLDQVEIAQADLCHLEPNDLHAQLSGARVVFHLAAVGMNPEQNDPTSIITTNVTGTLQILRAAQAARVDRFIYCGSGFEYGPGTSQSEETLPAPESVYGASKAAAWILVQTFGRRYGLPAVCLRPFMVYGPFEPSHGLIPYTIVRALSDSPMDFTHGDQTRDFVFVQDAVGAFLKAAVTPEVIGGTFNVCSGTATSVREVVATIVDLTGSRAVPRYGTLPHRDAEMRMLSGDPSRTKRHLGWSAKTSLREGLEKTIQWHREHPSRPLALDRLGR